jgi:hypothetical protein
MSQSQKDLREKGAERLRKASHVYQIPACYLLDWYKDDLEDVSMLPHEQLKFLILQYLDSKGISYEIRVSGR